MTRVLAICNRKGGCGKTTTAVNLACEWGLRGQRILLIDLDSQGHAGIGLGVVARRDEPTAHTIFNPQSGMFSEAIRRTSFKNVSVIPADRTFEGAWRGLGRGETNELDVRLLDRQLASDDVKQQFDIVILDTPPSLDPSLLNALAAADAALVPMVPHALSAEGIRQFIRLFYRVTTTIKPDLMLLGILPVMINDRINHQRQILSDVGRELGVKYILDGIRTDIRLAEAFSAQEPISVYSPQSRGAKDYRILTSQLSRLWNID
ncbi:ParA family protein [Asticcacaulis benevestitus]|uniref:AAA domain-containing protein n=1 Tax=Asticcacaulis benevestitus DSM 16100 = ATCC BAA-896 TaxID=1121022 RepID=V4Q496_9CAUL|nr:ParA family protein [Asticcacaulis benevestitus]ESQ92630.1 hypothetical protein ABENE_07370 [Asticcacaulis benevestitus DSM 16100 = ATCC BAA-896]